MHICLRFGSGKGEKQAAVCEACLCCHYYLNRMFQSVMNFHAAVLVYVHQFVIQCQSTAFKFAARYLNNRFNIGITASDVDIKFHIDYHGNDYDL